MENKKTKIYARTLDPEFFDYRIYEDIVTENKEIYIDGGRDYNGIQNDVLKRIKDYIDGYGHYEYEVYYHNSIREYTIDNLPKKINGKPYTPYELHVLKEMLEKENEYHYYSEFLEMAMITCLSIIHGTKYEMRKLRGSCQGEVVDCYCPATTPSDYTDWIEAWFFGTGVEIEIDDTGRDEVEDGNDILGYTFYTAKWRKEDLVEEILNQCYWISGISEDDEPEVVLWQFNGYTKTPKYKAS